MSLYPTVEFHPVKATEVWASQKTGDLLIVHYHKPVVIELGEGLLAIDTVPFVYESDRKFDFQQAEDPADDSELSYVGEL